jgi:tetratricopeptide (TPR) repeat protein
MTSSKELFLQAAELHTAGRLEAADATLAKLLSREPSNAAAWHLQGVIALQRGEPTRAVELINRALVLRPSVPGFHVTLADAYRQLGELRRAAGCSRTALKLCPDSPEALGSLGVSLQGLGRLDEAVDCFGRALELRPDWAPAHRDLGMALRELGRMDEAIAHLHRAVELAPDFPAARNSLGLALVDLGRPEDALEHFREAARLQPDTAIFHHNLGNSLRLLDRIPEARAAYLEALRLDGDLMLSHLQMGMTLRREGQLGEALPWYQQAVALEPEDPVCWEQLAELRMERQETDEAIACWRRAIDVAGTDRAQAHLGLGWALQEDGRRAEAAAEYRIAAELDPDSPLARVNLGMIHEELGEMEEAEAAYRVAIRLQPSCAPAHAKLGTMLRDRLPDPDFAALEDLLASPETNPVGRGRLLFARAVILDARGDYPGAAACARRANALNLEMARGQRAYCPDVHEQYVDHLVHGFGAEFFDRAAGAGLETRRPIFIVGLPRSGTTLLEQVLASHSRIYGAGELRLTRQSFDAIPAAANHPGPPPESISGLAPEAVRGLAGRHLERLEALVNGHGDRVERIVDKMPDNYLYLGLLAAMFPRATFIHCRRDLRDVAVSCWITDFRVDNIPWASDPGHIGSRFGQYLRVMDHWRDTLPVTIHEVDYEETVADLKGVARRLLAACDLDWEPACLDFHRTRRPVRTASIAQVRQPLYQRSVARWRNYERELADLFDALPVDRSHYAHAGAYQPDAPARETAPDPRSSVGLVCDLLTQQGNP